MENAIAVRDAVFYWTGVWALFSLADAGIVAAVLAIRNRNSRKQERRTVHKDERKDG